MRAFGVSAAVLAVIGTVSLSGTALAQKKVRAKVGSEQSNESGCGGNSDKKNHAPTANLKVTPSGSGADANRIFTLTTTATDPDNDTLSYNYTISGGRMSGEGATQVWDLSGVYPGTYEVAATIFDGRDCYAMIKYQVEFDS